MSKNNTKENLVMLPTTAIAKLFGILMLLFTCNSCTHFPKLSINNFNVESTENMTLTRDTYWIPVPCASSKETENMFNSLIQNRSLSRNTSSIYIDVSSPSDVANVLIIRKGSNVRYIADVNVTIFTRVMYGHGWHDFSTPVNGKLVIYQQDGNEILLLLR